jgi:hypothetical protein
MAKSAYRVCGDVRIDVQAAHRNQALFLEYPEEDFTWTVEAVAPVFQSSSSLSMKRNPSAAASLHNSSTPTGNVVRRLISFGYAIVASPSQRNCSS